MNHNAIYALYPSVVTIDDTTGCFDADGNLVDIDLELVNSWVNPDAYKQQRFVEYPSIGEQLDMLWHAIDANKLNKTSDFYITLKAVKDKYPKSE